MSRASFHRIRLEVLAPLILPLRGARALKVKALTKALMLLSRLEVMVVGETTRIKYTTCRDGVTGVEVTKLTDDVGNTIHPYFTQNLMTPDSEVILLTSDRTGWWQLYRLNIPDGELVQLTEDGNVFPHCPCLDGKHGVAYYWDGRFLKAVDIESFEIRIVYSIPPGFKPSILSITPDGRYLAFAYTEDVPLSTLRGREYSAFLEHMYLRPRSVVVRIDLEKEEVLPVWGETEWITHVNISPVDPNIILFCHEGPWHLVQRMWIARADTHEVWPLVPQKRYVERVGHEFFTNDGVVVAQYGRRSTPSSNDWTYYDLFVRPDGSGLRMYRYPSKPPAHIKVNSKASLAVGDRGYATPDFKEGGAFISLIKYNRGGTVDLKLLCRHDTSWLTQRSHPHPIFTPDDEYVIFTSDRGGRCNVYMAPGKWDEVSDHEA